MFEERMGRYLIFDDDDDDVINIIIWYILVDVRICVVKQDVG